MTPNRSVLLSVLVSGCILSPVALAQSKPVAPTPQIIAHRGGTADAPENTVPAIALSLKNGADAIWVTVQLSSDNIPVLYRPSDLKTLTEKQGPVSGYTAAELAKMDAGWAFGSGDTHPYRGKNIGIPTLENVLNAFPKKPFYIDIKSPDAAPEKMAVALNTVLKATHSLGRTRIYSTESKYLEALPAELPRFESRDLTRTALANITMAHQCQIAPARKSRWYALEMRRDVEVVEKFTLGEARSKVTLVWDKEAMKCFRSQGKSHIIFIGINNKADYRQAKNWVQMAC